MSLTSETLRCAISTCRQFEVVVFHADFVARPQFSHLHNRLQHTISCKNTCVAIGQGALAGRWVPCFGVFKTVYSATAGQVPLTTVLYSLPGNQIWECRSIRCVDIRLIQGVCNDSSAWLPGALMPWLRLLISTSGSEALSGEAIDEGDLRPTEAIVAAAELPSAWLTSGTYP